MIVKCMRPQNPNFSEEKMGLISAKKSIKTMVPYNGHALVEGSVLVGRTFRNHAKACFFVRTSELVCRSLQYGLGLTFRKRAILRREWFFFYAFPTVFREQNEQN